MPETRKRRFGDRYDGWRLRHTQSFFSVMPHIMKRRSDSSVLFDDVVEIEELEKYVRRLRRNENMPGFSMFHLFIAASVRMITLRPWLNRFVVGGKTYARNRLTISMTRQAQPVEGCGRGGDQAGFRRDGYGFRRLPQNQRGHSA